MKKMEPTENFVILPRQILSDLHAGRISGAEYFVYCYIRNKGNPYGVSQMTISELVAVYPHRVSDNYIYKLIRSLRTKRYVYYPDRSGRRGAFEVHMGDWILPTKQIKSLNRLFNPPSVRAIEEPKPSSQSESQPTKAEVSQSYLELKKHMSERFKMPPAK